MRFGLYGIGGVYNFGCEAIVRGAVKLIRDIDKNATIYYFSHSYEYDSKMLHDLGISVVSLSESRSLPFRVVRKASAALRMEKRPLGFDIDKILNNIEILVSIGGDIYTIPRHCRQQEDYDYYNRLADVCDRAVSRGKRVFLYGASVGPFGNSQMAVEYYKKRLSSYCLIACREMKSVEYLDSIGIGSNVLLFPDPAYQVHDGKYPKSYEMTERKPQIGINLSPLSLSEIYGSVDESCIDAFSHILESIVDRFDRDILLVPHVVSPDEQDDDERFMKKIQHRIQDEYRDRIRVASSDGGFLGAKKQLRSCEIVIAARMHCAINAIVEGIPTIFLSYSQKSVGMCEYLFDSDHWVIPLDSVREELLPRIEEMLASHSSIANEISKRLDCVENEYRTMLPEMECRIIGD